MMKRIMWAGLAIIAVPVTLTAGGDADFKKELQALAGTWNVVLPGTEASVRETIPKDPQPLILTFICRADGSATVEQALPEGPTTTTVALDLTRKPKRMVITHVSGSVKGKKQYAIYKLEEDALTILVTRLGAPEADRPADFSAKNGNARLMVFKRAKEEKK